jgi:hypothetical protein
VVAGYDGTSTKKDSGDAMAPIEAQFTAYGTWSEEDGCGSAILGSVVALPSAQLISSLSLRAPSMYLTVAESE